MKTISFKIQLNEKLEKVISQDSRIFSSIVRFSYNRCKEGLSKKEIYAKVNEIFPNINCHLRSCAQGEAFMNWLSNGKDASKKVYFGKFKRFQKGLITKEDYRESKNVGISSTGEANQKGNRLFEVDVENNKFIYKRNRKDHYDLVIVEKLGEKRRNLLLNIQNLMQEKKLPITFRLKKDKVYLSYDEKVVEKEKQFRGLFQNRVLGIDLNPNYFGISILEFNQKDKFKVLHKEVIDLTELQKKSKNKVHFELYEINHAILRLCKIWRISKIAVEDLKFKKNNKFWSKDLNRLCKSQFRYSFVKQHLQTLCNVYSVEMIEVNAVYSSIIGNFIHGSATCPDMVAASIEIARRAYHKFQKGWIYPKIVKDQRIQQVLGSQWKEELRLDYMSWKGLSGIIKKSKLKYRFQLQPSNAVFSHFDIKSGLSLYRF